MLQFAIVEEILHLLGFGRVHMKSQCQPSGRRMEEAIGEKFSSN
jgi:hypothetical protein